MSDRKGFVLFRDSWPMVELLTLEERGVLLTALFAYAAGDELPVMEQAVEIVFRGMKASVDQSAERYEATCEKRRAAANKRWADANGCKSMQMDANASDAMQNNANGMQTDANDAEIEIETEKEIETEVIEKKNSPSGSKKKKPKLVFPESLDQDFVREAFAAFKEMREKIHKPMTLNGAELILKDLEKHSKGDPVLAVKILEQSIKNSWQGVFPLKDNRPKGRIDWDAI